MSKEIIDQLSFQHKTIIDAVEQIKKNSTELYPQFEEILSSLRNLGKLMAEHLYLENEIVYKNIFSNPMHDAASVLSVEIFLREMNVVQNEIMDFLKKNNTEAKIKADFFQFKFQLEDIKDVLTSRIKLEEEILFALL